LKFNLEDNAALKVGAEVEVVAAAAVGVPVPLPAGVIEMDVDVALAVTPKPVVLPGAAVGILLRSALSWTKPTRREC
jgi:hypothetical protein